MRETALGRSVPVASRAYRRRPARSLEISQVTGGCRVV